MIQIFSAHGTDGTDQPKVVQEVLADLKRDLGVDEGHWNLSISAHLGETTPWKHKMRM